jgi:hypothetical protein
VQDPYNQYRLGLAHAGAGDAGKAKAWFAKASHFNGLPALNMAFVRQKASDASRN